MRLIAVHLAEFATVGQDNKLVIAGTLDSFNLSLPPGAPPEAAQQLQKLPLPPVYLVCVFECSLLEGTHHMASLRIVNEDEEDVVEAFDIGPLPFTVNREGRPLRAQTIGKVNGLQVPRPGDYRIEILVDGERMGDHPLYVNFLPLTGDNG